MSGRTVKTGAWGRGSTPHAQTSAVPPGGCPLRYTRNRVLVYHVEVAERSEPRTLAFRHPASGAIEVLLGEQGRLGVRRLRLGDTQREKIRKPLRRREDRLVPIGRYARLLENIEGVLTVKGGESHFLHNPAFHMLSETWVDGLEVITRRNENQARIGGLGQTGKESARRNSPSTGSIASKSSSTMRRREKPPSGASAFLSSVASSVSRKEGGKVTAQGFSGDVVRGPA